VVTTGGLVIRNWLLELISGWWCCRCSLSSLFNQLITNGTIQEIYIVTQPHVLYTKPRAAVEVKHHRLLNQYQYCGIYAFVKAPLQVQYWKNSTRVCGQETNTAWGKAECCIGLETHAQVLFYIVRAWVCFNWFKAFLVDKSFILATFTNSKLVTHVTQQCCIFQRMLYEKNTTVICFKFTHTNALYIICNTFTPQIKGISEVTFAM